MDPAQAPARDGRPRRNRVHGRQAAHDEDERAVLRVDEGQPLTEPFRARLERVERLAADVHRLRLTVDDARAFAFAAGQYVNVRHPGGLAIPFSVASAPERLPDLEIHFRPVPGAADAQAMQDLIAHARLIELEGPFGDVCVRGPTPFPLLLVAGGTGISQCLAIVEHLSRCRQTERVRLLWSVSARAHLYAMDALDAIRARHDWFEPVAAVDEPGGRNGAIAALTRRGVPAEPEVILAGSPPFVYAVCDALDGLGGYTGRLRSDVFAYAPRAGTGDAAPASSA